MEWWMAYRTDCYCGSHFDVYAIQMCIQCQSCINRNLESRKMSIRLNGMQKNVLSLCRRGALHQCWWICYLLKHYVWIQSVTSSSAQILPKSLLSILLCMHKLQIKSLKPLKDTFSTDEAADKPENCKLRRRNRKVDNIPKALHHCRESPSCIFIFVAASDEDTNCHDRLVSLEILGNGLLYGKADNGSAYYHRHAGLFIHLLKIG